MKIKKTALDEFFGILSQSLLKKLLNFPPCLPFVFTKNKIFYNGLRDECGQTKIISS